MRVFDLKNTDLPLTLAVVSDTHGPLDPQVCAWVRECDFAVHAGDIGGAIGLVGLRPRRELVMAVRGNNDVPEKWPPADVAMLNRLPEEAMVLLPGGSLIVVHGHRAGPAASRHDRLRNRFPGARAVVYGHSHRQVLDCAREPWILNPGAAGLVRTYGGPGALCLRIDAAGWQVDALRFSASARPRRT